MGEQVETGRALTNAPRQRSTILLLLAVLVGVLYEAILLFTPLLTSYRFPIPYAVPIFDSPSPSWPSAWPTSAWSVTACART
jgi:hypothetical protein